MIFYTSGALGHRRRRGGRGGPPAEGPGDTFKDYTKPRQIIQSPKKTAQRHKILDKAPTDYQYTKPRQTIQSPDRQYKDLKHQTKLSTY